MSSKRIVVTMGDPAGVGPYVTVKALAALSRSAAEFIVIGDAKVLARYGALVSQQNVRIVDMKNARAVKPGKVSASSGAASYEYLVRAVKLIRDGDADTIVTAPVSKEAISQACG